MSTDVPALNAIERTILRALDRKQSVSLERLKELTDLHIDQVRRGIEWLKFKELISLTENSVQLISLASGGKGAASAGLPERRLVQAIRDGKSTMAEILAGGTLRTEETNAAVAAAKRNRWIRFVEGGRMAVESITEPSLEELLIQKLKGVSIEVRKLSDEEKRGLDLLRKRPDYVVVREIKDTQVSLSDAGKQIQHVLEKDEQLESRLTPKMLETGKWKDVKLSALDVKAPTPVAFPGRMHPLVTVIEEIKEIFVGLGFEEIDGPMLQTGFWNFDALFIPQDHSAREMQDTFYVSKHKQDIPASDQQKRKVSQVHLRGWGAWKTEEAKRIVLRTHTTPVTLRHLADTRASVGRFFSVGRVFRNEKPSYKHLAEFYQVEGVATAPRLSLRDLMGLQKEFYSRMGIKKVKFWPTYFPYTEPSLQSMVYNESLQKWVELFGMGIFRPEVTLPLGIKNPVLAWGGGIERIAMLRLGLDDVRELYSNKFSWLRSVPRCPL